MNKAWMHVQHVWSIFRYGRLYGGWRSVNEWGFEYFWYDGEHFTIGLGRFYVGLYH